MKLILILSTIVMLLGWFNCVVGLYHPNKRRFVRVLQPMIAISWTFIWIFWMVRYHH